MARGLPKGRVPADPPSDLRGAHGRAMARTHEHRNNLETAVQERNHKCASIQTHSFKI